jgi:hypothetical protein
MEENRKSEELITTLGESYWEAAMRLVEKCNEKNTEVPTIEIPLFSGLILAEGRLDDELSELTAYAKNSIFMEIKELLDVFMLVEKKLSK